MSRAAVKHVVNQLRAMLFKSLVLRKVLHISIRIFSFSFGAQRQVTFEGFVFNEVIFGFQKNVPQNLPSPAAPAGIKFSPVQAPLQSLYPVQRGGTWRPNLQSISERDR